ncbi:MAG: hypothetical protein ACE37F_05025 [Nannocystaceae bacterium]|nr:hypothetical protein [bacterium]
MSMVLAAMLHAALPPDHLALRAAFERYVADTVLDVSRKRAAFCAAAGDTAAARYLDATEDERRTAMVRNNDAAGANILGEGGGTSTGAERLAAAVDTGLDGVEAGVAISPLALVPSFAPKTPHGPVVSVAALKDGRTRVGAGYGVTVRQPTDAAAALRRTACGAPDARAESITKAVQTTLDVTVENAYVEVCGAMLPELAGYEAAACPGESCSVANARAERVRRACSTDVDVQRLWGNADQLADDDDVPPRMRAALRSVHPHTEALEEAAHALVATAQGVDTEAFLQTYRGRQWKAVTVRLGVDGSADFERREFGTPRLEPADPGEPGEPEALDRGELLGWRVGPAVLLKAGRTQLGLSLTAGQASVVGSTSLFTALGPSASVSWLVGFLDHENVDRTVAYGERVPGFDDDGKLPPHVVLGLRASSSVAITQPAFQSTPLNAASVLLHADFVVSKTLKFRLGVPVNATLALQAADTDAEPNIARRTVLRWTVPVVGTTVVAF